MNCSVKLNKSNIIENYDLFNFYVFNELNNI